METIKIHFNNPSQSNNGIFEGWGTSLCWWANRVGYSPALTEKCATLFFSKDGLNLNIMRYNIGGGDNPNHRHITRTDSMVPGWLKYNEEENTFKYDYIADKNQLNVLEACYKANKSPVVEVFSNSPPYFMTKSGCSSGGKDPNENNLKDECVNDFAEYLAAVTQYINNTLKIKVTSLSPMNEPDTDYWHYLSDKQEGCHFDCGESQNIILLATYDAMKKHNLNKVLLTGSDETSTEKALNSYKCYNGEVKRLLKRINTHTYGSEKADDLGKLMKKECKDLWMSETDWGDTAGENAGEMGAGLWLSEKIIKDINSLSPSAWVLWQVIDYHKSKDGYMGNKDFGIPNTQKGYWGLAFADHDTEEIILTQKYYCMGQFSKFINPGDTIQHISKNVLCASNNNQIKLVAVNTNSAEMPLKIDLKATNKAFKTAKQIRTSGNIKSGEHWAKLPNENIDDNLYLTSLKGNSVTTFIFE